MALPGAALATASSYGKLPGTVDRRLGIVRLAQVLEDLLPLVGAELLLERREEHAVPHLLAAVGAEARGDQRGRRDHVVRRVRLLPGCPSPCSRR